MLFLKSFSSLRGWLARAPIDDPVDRLNAPFMQCLLVAIAAVVLLIRIYAYGADALPGASVWTLARWMDFGTDMAIAASAVAGVFFIRKGRFRLGIWLPLCTLLASAAASYAVIGYRHSPPDPFPIVMIAAAGMVLGRRALWVVYAATMGVFAIGELADATWLGAPGGTLHSEAFRTLPMLVVGFLFVAVILDRAIAALRTALDQSIERGRALAAANIKLEAETEERERARSQLIHARKMDAVGRLASGVAHDFDNVLGVVLGYASQREQLADMGTPALLGALEGVELAAIRALAISRKLLDFSRQDILRTEDFAPGQVVLELEPMLRQLLGRYIRLELSVCDEPVLVCQDRSQFELMILNIAANARDAMPEGGVFSIDVACTGRDVRLRLSDDGAGMPEEVRARVFEPFYTTKPVGSGTGLGLSLVSSLVATAGGRIAVSSRPAAGTTFTIDLPKASSPGDSPSHAM